MMTRLHQAEIATGFVLQDRVDPQGWQLLAGPPHPGVTQELRAVPRAILQCRKRRRAAFVQRNDAGGTRP